jgi:hypothetical protein
MLSNILYRILSKGCPNLVVAQDISSCRRVCEKKLRPKHHKTGIYAWSTSGISRTREEKDWRKKIRHIIIVRSKLFKTFSLRTATSLIVLLEQRESSQHVKKLYFSRRSSKKALIRKRRNRNVGQKRIRKLTKQRFSETRQGLIVDTRLDIQKNWKLF